MTAIQTPSGFLNNTDWLNVVTKYHADPAGVLDSTTAIQNALTAAAVAGGTVYLPAGTYLISGQLTAGSNTVIRGDGREATTIRQSSTTAVGIAASGITYLTISNLTVKGPSSGSGIGIDLQPGAANRNALVVLEDLHVVNWGSHGLFLDTLIVSVIRNVNSEANGGDGFFLTSATTVGTSVTMTGCYANANTGSFGYLIKNMQYSTLIACANDNSSHTGYELLTCSGVSLVNCGCEVAGANGYILTGGTNNSLLGCRCFNNNAIAAWVTGSEKNAIIDNFVEVAPIGGATASVQTDAATSAVVTSPAIVTAASYSAGTAFVITSAGGVAH